MWLLNKKGQSLVGVLTGTAIGAIALVAVGSLLVSSTKYYTQTRGKAGMVDEVTLLQKRMTQASECMKIFPTDSLKKTSFAIPWDNFKMAVTVKGTSQFQRITGTSKSAELNLKITDTTTSETKSFKIPIAILVNPANQEIISCSTQSMTSVSANDCVVEF